MCSVETCQKCVGYSILRLKCVLPWLQTFQLFLYQVEHHNTQGSQLSSSISLFETYSHLIIRHRASKNCRTWWHLHRFFHMLLHYTFDVNKYRLIYGLELPHWHWPLWYSRYQLVTSQTLGRNDWTWSFQKLLNTVIVLKFLPYQFKTASLFYWYWQMVLDLDVYEY